MRFSLVIPCYNEAQSLEALLERCDELIVSEECEVILVDNGSTDNTLEILEQLLPKYPGCRVIHLTDNQGYGYGILAGLNSAKGKILGWTHADMQTDPKDALRGLDLFDKYGTDIFVKGSRYGRPLGDIIFTIGMSVFETLLLRKPLWDINAQPTMFSKDFYETWSFAPDDFALDLFAYYKALKCGNKVYRFPVKFDEREYGISNWNMDLKSKWKFIKRTFSYSLQLLKRF
jgi:glycosyltransferase involved in cell wall biosynthesis